MWGREKHGPSPHPWPHKDQIYSIFGTMPTEILDLTAKCVRDAARILVEKGELAPEGTSGYSCDKNFLHRRLFYS